MLRVAGQFHAPIERLDDENWGTAFLSVRSAVNCPALLPSFSSKIIAPTGRQPANFRSLLPSSNPPRFS